MSELAQSDQNTHHRNFQAAVLPIRLIPPSDFGALAGVHAIPARIKCATLSWHAAIDSLVRYLQRDNRNVHRCLHALSMRATDAYEGARTRIAKFIPAADPAEIIFRRRTTEIEHHSNFILWQ
jgi:hypothetical protein